MLNEAAKKLVARAARVEASERRADVAGGIRDEVVEAAWDAAVSLNPDFREWPSARSYFEAVFIGEVNPHAY
jgi:hypothetical protein